jgi:hypothetical protein
MEESEEEEEEEDEEEEERSAADLLSQEMREDEEGSAADMLSQEMREDEEDISHQYTTEQEDESLSRPPRKKLRIAAFAVAPSECIIKAVQPSDQRLTAVAPAGSSGVDVKLFSDSLEMSCLVRCRACNKIITWDSFSRHAEKSHKEW